MKMRSILAVTVFAAFSLQEANVAQAQSAGGNFHIYVNGYLRVPLSVNGGVGCSASAILVPDTTSAPTVGNLSAAILANTSLASSVAAPATVSGQNFSCQVDIPFLFNSVVSGQKILIVYTIKVIDPNSFNFSTNPPTPIVGSGTRATRQLIPNVIPSNGDQSFSVNAYL